MMHAGMWTNQAGFTVHRSLVQIFSSGYPTSYHEGWINRIAGPVHPSKYVHQDRALLSGDF
jgi:hypothetical protein